MLNQFCTVSDFQMLLLRCLCVWLSIWRAYAQCKAVVWIGQGKVCSGICMRRPCFVRVENDDPDTRPQYIENRRNKTTLVQNNCEVDEEAWESLHSDTSRPLGKPESGRIAVKVINHLGDEVMKVFRVG
jgi:hypothetical protein